MSKNSGEKKSKESSQIPNRVIMNLGPRARYTRHLVNLEYFKTENVPVEHYQLLLDTVEFNLKRDLKWKVLLALARADAERIRLYWLTDPDTKTGEQVRSGAKMGAKSHSKSNEQRRKDVIFAMDRYITGKGLSKSNAARIVANQGVGTSQQANVKLWDRYSEEILKTVPPAV